MEQRLRPRAGQQTFDAAWEHADGADHDENARVFARMATAVAIAHELAGITSTSDHERRLAYVLKYLWFAGGTTRRGSAAYVKTIASGTRNCVRTTERLLKRLADLGLISVRRSPRSSFRKLQTGWIDELIRSRQSKPRRSSNVADHSPRVADHSPRVADHSRLSDVADGQSGGPPPPEWRIDRKRDLKEKLNKDRSTWSEFVDLVGSESLATEVASVVPSPVAFMMMKAKRTGDSIDDIFWEIALTSAVELEQGKVDNSNAIPNNYA